MMDEVVVFIEQKSMGELILNNLFSEETDKYYNNCAFTSDRMAFMQGMIYASLLCFAKLKHYPATIRPEPPKEEAYRDFKQITNYTRLVAKSPKELVEWINSVESDARYYGPKGKDVWLKWLQEVAE